MKKKSKLILLVAVVSLLIWFQGNVLVWEYGLLDGKNINWDVHGWRGWVDLSIWLSVIVFSLVFYEKILMPVIYFAFSIFILQTVFFIYSFSQEKEYLLSKGEPINKPDALVKMADFSKRSNVIHIILDGFQSDVFEEIISNVSYGEYYKNKLNGFTFYREHMGVFPTTYMTAPAILSGQIYKNHIPKNEFVHKIYSSKTILNAAINNGFEVDLSSEAHMLSMYKKGPYTNAFVIPDNFHIDRKINKFDDASKLLDLTLFRLLPHFLKKYIYNDQKWLIQPLLLDVNYQRFRYFSHTAFTNFIADNIATQRTSPVYKYFHIMNTHWPMVVNNQCEYVGRTLPRNRLTVTAQSKCSLDAVIKILDSMKKNKIFDDSIIVIMSDHGAYLPPYRYKSEVITDNNNSFKIEPWLVAQVTPLMLIKLSGTNTKPLTTSDVPSSIIDTAATIASILEFNEEFSGQSILDISTSVSRERKHYFYEWKREDWVTDYTGPIQEFIVEGSIYDIHSWRLGEVFYPPKGSN